MKRIDKRRTEELREEVGVKGSFRRKLARSRLMWVRDVERIEGERLAQSGRWKEKRRTET